jgi:hypothetical protein
MPLATRTTEWMKSESGIERRVRWFAGFDCRTECEHEVKGKHGQHGDEIWLEVRLPDAALTLRLFTYVRNGQVLSWIPRGRLLSPAYVVGHFGFNFDESHVLTSVKPSECDVLNRPCWPDEEGSVQPETLWPPDADSEIESALLLPNVQVVLVRVPAVWKHLESELTKQREAKWQKHLALPERCDKCNGTGLVHPSAPRVGSPLSEVHVHMAEPLGSVSVDPKAIAIDTVLPNDGVAQLYEEDAERVTEALFSTLPQATLDWLVAKMLSRRAGIYRGLLGDRSKDDAYVDPTWNRKTRPAKI